MQRRLVTEMLVLAVMSLMTARQVQAADESTQEVRAALLQFHEALNVLFEGDAAPMKAVWSHAADVSYMGPYGGTHHGWSEVEAYWDTQAAKKLGGKVDPVDVCVAASPTLAVVHYHETGEHVIGGQSQAVNIRTTTTFRKEGGKWKVIGHHTDLLEFPSGKK